ncbi:MAG: sulfotransferase [Acidimicrobiales bacterium]
MPKEPMYFLGDTGDPVARAAYFDLFADGADRRYRGDASNRYLANPDAIARIRKITDDAVFILMLRNPLERALSQYAWATSLGHESLPLAQAIEREPTFEEMYSGDRAGLFRNYLIESRYSVGYERLVEQFGAERVLVLTSEQLQSDPAGTVRRCTDFLGLAPLERVSEIVANRTPAGRFGRLSAVLTSSEHSDPRVGQVQRALAPVQRLAGRSRTALKVRDRVLQLLGGTRAGADEGDRATLRERLADDVARLRRLTGLDLAEWSTDFPG